MRESNTGAHPLDLEDYDWRKAFELAGREVPAQDDDWRSGIDNLPHLQACAPGIDVDTSEFTRRDVAQVETFANGENDEADWLCFGQLKDGRWFMLRAGCDYTGWDCQSGGLVDLAPDRETLLRYGVTPEERKRLWGESVVIKGY